MFYPVFADVSVNEIPFIFLKYETAYSRVTTFSRSALVPIKNTKASGLPFSLNSSSHD